MYIVSFIWYPAGKFGGGAGSRGGGGTGGGGGSSRLTVKPDDKELVFVTVGKGGEPSYGKAADGLVVVVWGDYSVDKIAEHDINECLTG